MTLQHSAYTPVMPTEIWMLVAQFIPDTDLRSLFRINRVFFQLSMDSRYHELELRPDADVQGIWRMRRARDPFISHRVRHLYVHLIDDDKFLHKFDKEGNLNVGWPGISLLEGIQIMTETVACLTNVTEFSVDWTNTSLGEHLVPFLIAAWKSFGSGLRKLWFMVRWKNLTALLSSADKLVSLRHLDMNIFGDESFGSHSEAVSTALALFVNKVGSTLHSFSHWSFSDSVDLSSFFHNLEKIPNLERLSVMVDKHGTLLTDSSVLTRFLCNHGATLRHLHWDDEHALSPQQDLMDLQNGNNLKEVFSNLFTLQLQVPAVAGGFAQVVQHLGFSAETLTSLVLYDDYHMTWEETNTVISVFAPHGGANLKVLDLRVQYVSPELFLLLAQTLPRLETLTVNMMHITGHEVGKRSLEAINTDDPYKRERDERANAGIFAETMRTYDLHDWALRHISIRAASRETLILKKLMWVVADCVPSVQTFYGREKEFYAIERGSSLMWNADPCVQ